MTTREQEVNKILEENERRMIALKADYDPVTGLGSPCFSKRVELKIPDFAVPVQYVPKEMMKNRFIKNLVKCGSIAKFLEKYPDDPKINNAHEVEKKIRSIRHKYDFPNWAWFCIKIKLKQGGRGRFKLNRAQQELFLECERLRLSGSPIDIVLAKARQWGGSTLCFFYQIWILFKWDHYHSFAIAAHIGSASQTIFNMLRSSIATYPAWDLGLPESSSIHLAPSGKLGNSFVIRDETDKQVFDAEIHIGTAERPGTLRSKDISGAHYSEVAFWPDTPQKQATEILQDISGGILKRPLTMQVQESTAKTSDDFFHDNYILAKQGKSNYTALFIGWFKIAHDTLEIDDKIAFVNWLLDHKDDNEPHDKWRMPGNYYWYMWSELGATLEGINWYRYKELDFTARSQMLNEAPCNDIEMFISAGDHVFDFAQVEAMRKYCKTPMRVGRLISNDRRDRGVLQNIRFIEQTNGPLVIYEDPDDSPVSNRYVVSVDIGGKNPTSDFHSVRVMDRFMMMPEYKGRPSIVAEMHYHCDRHELVYDAIRLAEYYNHALLVIESNTLEMSDAERNVEGDGSEYVLDVAAGIYSNLYAREAPADQIIEGAPKRWGFQTNARTKPMIIDFAQWAIKEQAWIEPSSDCLDEFAIYIIDGNKFTAPPRKHDDILMSTLILLWICFNEMPLPKWVIKEDNNSIVKPVNMATF